MAAEAVRIVDRPVAAAISRAALDLGYTPLQARIIAGRLSDADVANLPALLNLQLNALTPPDRLPDIDIASECAVSAITQGLPSLVSCRRGYTISIYYIPSSASRFLAYVGDLSA